ncbi:glucosamine-6-phosphate deaminase [Clostridium sporogenes]|uniref:glucosamine-6-phosphate deaminase n=1 Tax=Clostridium sporogenes TaxID=1509 RepID=UPI0013CCA92B|nr:glucosamine-6-phosphate deaminase [Clostridium sporogenes]MCW6059653.1 glucosamine-6-phosphate deaminase [Clostridium sporogenes]MCW6069157.1 glucosamine-6-phosphate deaminase [Clostridium sporogenes]NFQ01178.1 glucosamine-6-phosphate deaminase [Clostridium sporogenes]NFQ41751.1 glucosamine-6-phosphate deaminase [Clostridium sporogenes]NFT02637.1 glucosamine-6-phosphate deaminase [Clostridium sporogenes]
MRIIVVENYEEMSKKAAVMIASQIILKPNSVLGLATGDTPLGMYKELIEMYHKKQIDFSEAKSFNLDEYYGLEKNNSQSYHHYMMESFFSHINIDKEKINIPDGKAENIEEECKSYDKKISDAGDIDIQVLGIGVNGHIGFNEPSVEFKAGTHLVNLDEKTIKSNSRFFNSIEDVPTKAISMGIKTILSSKKIVLLANGKGKADAIAKTVKGKICPEVPASVLQFHKDVTIILDKEAAEKL